MKTIKTILTALAIAALTTGCLTETHDVDENVGAATAAIGADDETVFAYLTITLTNAHLDPDLVFESEALKADIAALQPMTLFNVVRMNAQCDGIETLWPEARYATPTNKAIALHWDDDTDCSDEIKDWDPDPPVFHEVQDQHPTATRFVFQVW